MLSNYPAFLPTRDRTCLATRCCIIVLSSSKASFPIDGDVCSSCACVSNSLRRRSQRLGGQQQSGGRAWMVKLHNCEQKWVILSGRLEVYDERNKQAAPFLQWSHPVGGTDGPDRWEIVAVSFSPLLPCAVGRTYAHNADLTLHDVLLIPWPKARCMLGLFYERYVSQTSDPCVAIFKRLFEASSSLLTFFALLASRMGLRQVGVGGRLDAETSIIS